MPLSKGEQRRFDECVEQAKEIVAGEKPEDIEELDAWRVRVEEGAEAVESKALWLWIRWKGMTDFWYFVSEVMRMKDAVDAKSKRHRLDPRLHRQMCEEIAKEDDTLGLYPRGTLKSTIVKLWILWQIIRNPNIRIALFSRTMSLVRKELRHLKMLACSPQLLELWPEIFVPRDKFQIDTQDQLVIYRDETAAVPPQEPQVEIWGVDSTVTGNHYDIHVYDDIINEQSVTNSTQIEKVREWWQMLQVVKEITAVEKIIGTRYHMHDIYGEILEEEHFPAENITIRSAIEGGRSIYSFYTMKDLERLRRRMGEYAFSTQMLNDAVPKGRRIFIGPYPTYEPQQVPNDAECFITVDPAATASGHSDETAFAIAKHSPSQPQYLYYEEVFGVKETPDVVASILVEKIIQHRPRRVGIELGLQQALFPLIAIKLAEKEAQLKEYLAPQWVEIPTGKMNKADKFSRTIGAMIRDGRAKFRPTMKSLFRQFDMYNPFSDKNDDDLIDACSMMFMTIPRFAPAHWMNVQEANKHGYSWNMTFDQIFEERKRAMHMRKGSWGWKFAS